MNRLLLFEATLCVGLSLFVIGCERRVKAQQNLTAGTGIGTGIGTGKVPTEVEPEMDWSNFKMGHPEQFPLATAGEHVAARELNVTGVVNPDVSRQVPVP